MLSPSMRVHLVSGMRSTFVLAKCFSNKDRSTMSLTMGSGLMTQVVEESVPSVRMDLT